MAAAQLFNLKTLHLLGAGDLERDFEATLASLVKDCTARPSVGKKRQVSLVVDMTPKVNADGSCDDVVVSVQVVSKAPAKMVDPYVMRATVNGGLKYQPDSPGNPAQESLGFEE